MLKLSFHEGVTWDTLNMCAYGMCDPASHLYYLNAITLLHNVPAGALDPIFRRCPNSESGSEVHQHQKIEKSVPGYGDRAALSQIYPMPFCRKLVKLIDPFLHFYSRPAASPKQTSLLCDLLDMADLTLQETKLLAKWSETETVAECCLSHVSDCLAVAKQVAPVPVYDGKCKLLMDRINALLRALRGVCTMLRQKRTKTWRNWLDTCVRITFRCNTLKLLSRSSWDFRRGVVSILCV